MSHEKQADLPNFDGLVQPGRDAQHSAKSNENLGDLGGSLVADAQPHTDSAEPADLTGLYGERGGIVVPPPGLSEEK